MDRKRNMNGLRCVRFLFNPFRASSRRQSLRVIVLVWLAALFSAPSYAADTTAPTAPTGLTATAASSTQINLSWTASTDNVGVTGYRIERCTGSSCTSYTQIATSTTTTYSNTGLTAGTAYRYRVRANDAAGNLSSYSSVVTATTQPPDTQAPTAPTGLTATAASSAQINLSWTASTDNMGVTGYRIERCAGSTCTTYTQIATSTTTSYSNAGLTASTTYRYRVRANDAAGNLSGYSSVINATTPADTTAPTAPAGLTATAASGTQINLSWTASTDNVSVTGYRIERCSGVGCSNFAQIATTTTAVTYSNTGLTSATSYSYRVRANDAAGNLSGYSTVATTSTLDTTVPTPPTGFTASVISSTQINLSWTASTDNVGVTGYRIERCTGASCTTYTQIATSTTATYSNTGLTVSTTYRYRVRANDAAGNLSSYSSVINATTPADTTAPTAPTGLTATVASGTQINLSWTAATDNVGVTGYRIERCSGVACSNFAQIATTTTAVTYSNTGLTNGTSYSYRVRANDAASNLSSYSTVTTTSTLDTTLPTPPTSFTATAVSSTQINLSWTASTDNVGVTGYRIERCQGASCSSFAQIATPTTTSYSDTGLIVSTNYSYRVRATDAGGNLSTYSSVATATTPADTQAPTAPTGLTTTAASGTQINLSWTAATDNIGVTGYLLERCQGASCTTFAQIATPTVTTYSDIGLTTSTSYSYRVRATDAANNLSSYSSTASATTPDTQAPTAPSGLTASAASSTQINLSWTASTDNVGVTGYLLERCQGASCSSFAQIATPTITTYSDSGLTASTSYSYRIRATDAANNLSSYSDTSSATTQAPPDTQAPTAPSNVSATAISTTQINVSWTASTDDVGVTGYLLERCQGASCSSFAEIASTTSTTYSDAGLSPATNYTYRVRAMDAATNVSSYSNTANATTQNPGPITYTYSYDALGRITNVAGSDGSSIDYQYDANGNITAINRH